MQTSVDHAFDLICLGRAAVDLYGEQIGSPLEDVQSFAKSLGGCAANVAVGAARQGLRVAMLTRVGDEHMGRFVRSALAAEGIDVGHVKTDPDRLTGLVLLSVRDRETFPLLFYRERCADMALSPDDFDRDFVASARVLLLTGTHLSEPTVERATRAAIGFARDAGTRIVLDVDYRPVLWSLRGHGDGEERFAESARVTEVLRSIVGDCDLIVGTEDEIRVAGGAVDLIEALRKIRTLSSAVIVVKRGPLGCVVFPSSIPSGLDGGIVIPGLPVEVLNVLGAGDAFLSGFLRGWIASEPLETCALYGNASGALVVSRHGCAPAMPSRLELDDYLRRIDEVPRIDLDPVLNRLHRVTTRDRSWPELCVLAFDHRRGLEALAAKVGADPVRLVRLKTLIAEGGLSAVRTAEISHAGMIIDDRYGRDALERMTGCGLWIARPIERSGAFPGDLLEFEGEESVELTLRRWPKEHVIKCLVHYHPNHEKEARRAVEKALSRLQGAAIALERELLLEVIPMREGSVDLGALPRALEELYASEIRPDWWKLPPPAEEDWPRIESIVTRNDPHSRGILLLGLDAPERELIASFRAAAPWPVCKGFAVGRTIFAGPAERWLDGRATDEALISEIALGFGRMIEMWSGWRR